MGKAFGTPGAAAAQSTGAAASNTPPTPVALSAEDKKQSGKYTVIDTVSLFKWVPSWERIFNALGL